MRDVFRYQFWHLLSIVILVTAIQVFFLSDHATSDGALWGVSTVVWLWLAIAIPVAHQIYVWIVWRLELFYSTFTSRWGMKAFSAYLAYSNRNTLTIEPAIAYGIAAVITACVLYLFYSVKKYFGFERAYGIDHFDKDYNEPYVKGGIFRFVDNAMYVFGLMVLYLPGLLLFSKAAVLAAIFNHVYIWVHYYCTERPDMEKIYGKLPGQ